MLPPNAKFYPIGTVYKQRDIEHTIVAILRTYDHNDCLDSIHYVSEHVFCGQLVKTRGVVALTVARNFVRIGEIKPDFTDNWFTAAFEPFVEKIIN